MLNKREQRIIPKRCEDCEHIRILVDEWYGEDGPYCDLLKVKLPLFDEIIPDGCINKPKTIVEEMSEFFQNIYK